MPTTTRTRSLAPQSMPSTTGCGHCGDPHDTCSDCAYLPGTTFAPGDVSVVTHWTGTVTRVTNRPLPIRPTLADVFADPTEPRPALTAEQAAARGARLPRGTTCVRFWEVQS